MTTPASREDSRLYAPRCLALQPVTKVHENPWFTVCQRGAYYTVEYSQPQVILVPVIGKNSFLMIRARRPVLDDAPLEFPAGSSEPGESPVQAAARELSEETGILVSDLSRFTSLPPVAASPNRDPLLLHIFRIDVSEEEFACRKPHDDEVEGVERISFPEAADKIARGDIYVVVPLALISRFLLQEGVSRKVGHP